ncbi:response regulator transcription factor [Microlunatus flavus]|uniref:response regulator transcription factor n=1 Tax=Microlunatus flavus TaxID=1036181 RepID=UPI00147DD71F|nr:response regulator transcription factor [Microlunatus flavus]
MDDHQCFADLLAASLDYVDGMRCVGTASDADEAVEKVRRLRPSVVVMDIQMPGTDGLAATRAVRLASPETAVAVVTAHQDREWVVRAARAGASAFIPKDGSLAEMISLLKGARPGTMQVAPSARGSAHQDPPEDHGLTAREREVLGYIAQGLEVKSIAKVMGITVHTCRSYIKSVYATLQVSSRIAAVNRARELRLIAP